MTDTRSDLVDRGEFVPPVAPSTAASRRPWAALTGNDLNAPKHAFVETFYDARGSDTADEGAAVAKSADDSYFVKAGTGGNTRGHFVDPRGVYHNPDDLSRQVRATGRAAYEYKRVSPEAFTKYVQYLRTGKTNLLREAERESQNA